MSFKDFRKANNLSKKEICDYLYLPMQRMDAGKRGQSVCIRLFGEL